MRAYHHTYGLPTLTTNCSNNYGPYQFPEKLIPLMILNALEGKPLPVYGDGRTCATGSTSRITARAIRRVLERGRPGETYNIGGDSERTNLDVVRGDLRRSLDELRPGLRDVPCRSLITFVKDRPGHDRRYAIDASKIERELGWRAAARLRDRAAQDGRLVSRQPAVGRRRDQRRVPALGDAPSYGSAPRAGRDDMT